MIVKASDRRVNDYRPLNDRGRIVSSRGDYSDSLIASVITLVATTLVLFLIALIAAASFTVIAQRRLPQLGMMAAVGASEKQLRLTMLATGAVTGLVAALLGTAIGLTGWISLAPRMEQALGFRIDPLHLPWGTVAGGTLLAVAAATAAAWWPGRTMSRIPPVLALSGRPPRPVALHRSTLVSAAFVAGGAVSLGIGTKATGSATALQLVLIAVGTLAVVAGVLMLSPLAIRALARSAARTPVAARLALRDLSRYQAQSGAALAAITLALGIPVAVLGAAAAAENNMGMGNLSASQLLARPSDLDGPFLAQPDTEAQLEAGVEEIAALLDRPTVIRLDAAVLAGATTPPGLAGTPAVSVVRPQKDGFADPSIIYVATPELLALYGHAASGLGPDMDVVTSRTGDLRIFAEGGPAGATERPTPEPLTTTAGSLPATYTSLPDALVSPEQLAARGWQAMPSGRWLIQARHPLSTDQLSEVRQIAAAHGFSIERRDTPKTLDNLRLGSVTVGMLLALGILAMTVGLIRSESIGELRTLTATGATSSARRAITATTAAALAGLGAVLAICGAYVALAAARLHHLAPLPWLDLAIVAIGTPLVAATAGWLLAGREPAVLARQPIE